MVKPKPFTFLIGMVSILPPFMLSAVHRISAIAKIPIRVGRVSKPAIRLALPKVKRGVPSIGAIPIKVNIRPNRPARRPRIMLPEERIATIVRAKKQIPKFSAGVNFSATSASSGAQKVRMRKEKMEPIAENTIPTPRAFIASPFFAIGCPSKQVAMEDAVPGIFSRIAEIRPPEIPPI